MVLGDQLGWDRPAGRLATAVAGVLLLVCLAALLVPLGWATPMLTGGTYAQSYECGPALLDVTRTGPSQGFASAGFAEAYSGNPTPPQIAARNRVADAWCGTRARNRLALVVLLLVALVVISAIALWIVAPRRRPPPPGPTLAG